MDIRHQCLVTKALYLWPTTSRNQFFLLLFNTTRDQTRIFDHNHGHLKKHRSQKNCYGTSSNIRRCRPWVFDSRGYKSDIRDWSMTYNRDYICLVRSASKVQGFH